MPRIKSAKKKMRQAAAHLEHNRAQRSAIKTAVKKARAETTPESVRAAIRALDRGFQAAEPMRADKLPFGKAFAKSLEQNKKNSFLIIELVEKMVQRKVSVKQFSSPIGIAQASGEAARQQGWTPLLQLMSAISLNLAIFNLFPFPILDGGMILFLAIEGIRRRDISLRLKERIYQLAFVLLVLFAVIVIYNDLAKTIPSLQRLP